MQRQYTIVAPDGTERIETLEKKATLEQLQSWVGGMIEGVQITTSQYAYVNEEGLILGLPMNSRFPYLAGSVVLCPRRCTT